MQSKVQAFASLSILNVDHLIVYLDKESVRKLGKL